MTDADLLLGYLNPENYLGGNMLLDPDLSRKVIREKIADPLGIDPVAAAVRIRQVVDARMGQEVFNEVALKGHDPREFVLMACGGAGATHACGFAPYLKVEKVIVSPHSPVFGAFGASTVNVSQVWEMSRTMKIFQWATQSYSDDVEVFNHVVAELKNKAVRDLQLEGYSEDRIEFRLELDMRYGMQYNLMKVVSPRLTLRNSDDFKAICDEFTRQYAEVYSPEATFPMGGINLECFHLTAMVLLPPLQLEVFEENGQKPSGAASLPAREVYWAALEGFVKTPVFAFNELLVGNEIDGPALVEADDTTYVIEPGWRFVLDRFRNAILSI